MFNSLNKHKLKRILVDFDGRSNSISLVVKRNWYIHSGLYIIKLSIQITDPNYWNGISSLNCIYPFRLIYFQTKNIILDILCIIVSYQGI